MLIWGVGKKNNVSHLEKYRVTDSVSNTVYTRHWYCTPRDMLSITYLSRSPDGTQNVRMLRQSYQIITETLFSFQWMTYRYPSMCIRSSLPRRIRRPGYCILRHIGRLP